MLDYQNQETGFSEYKTVILGSLKKKLTKKAEEIASKKNDVYASDDKYGSYSDSGNKSVIGKYLMHMIRWWTKDRSIELTNNISDGSFLLVEVENDEDEHEAVDTTSDPLAEARKKEVKLLEGELSSVQEISFAFRRCTSRLIEMSSKPKDFSWVDYYNL
jgi:hypothetical protein